MYKIITKEYTAPNGKKRIFTYREDTNDENVIRAAFVEDEYKIMDLEFKSDDNVMDIGAHIGAVSLLLSTVNPGLNLIAYEPIEGNFELLNKNLRQNNLENHVNIFKQAIWFYEEDEVKMYYPDNSEGGRVHKFIGSQFLFAKFRDKRLFKRVPSVSLSKAFEDNRITKCAFIKMDCEGAEYGIIKGASQTVLEAIERIHGEYHNIDPQNIKKPREQLLKLARGAFKDVTPEVESGNVGSFIFVKK